jgi:prophage regulatory protein
MQQHSSLLRLREVQRISGLSRSSIYRMEAAGKFPARVKLSERAIAWREAEIHRTPTCCLPPEFSMYPRRSRWPR